MVKIHEKKRADSISRVAYSIQTLSYTFYIIHGLGRLDYPVVGMGIIAIAQNLIILALCYYYRDRRTVPTKEKGDEDCLK